MNKLNGVFSDGEYSYIMESMYKTSLRNMVKFCERFPDIAAENGIYKYSDKFYDACHGGWWTGIFYMLYDYSGDKKLLYYANVLTDNFYTLIKTKRILHREMGFIYQPICVNDMRYNNSRKACEMLLLAADYMIERFCETLYNPKSESYTDSLVKSSFLINSIIFHTASKISGLSKYREFADKLEKLIVENIIEADGYCHMDVKLNGAARKEVSSYDEEFMIDNEGVFSRRGSVWMLLGLAVFYSYKKDLKYLNLFDLIISGLLNDPKINNKQNYVFNLDTTSLSIMCSALAELIKVITASHKKFDLYKMIFINTMRYLVEFFFLESSLGNDGFLDGGRFLGAVEDIGNKKCVPTVCGDYHFLQAMMHIRKEYISCWNIEKLN